MASGVAPSNATNWLRTTLALYGAVALDNPVTLDDVGSSSAVDQTVTRANRRSASTGPS
jgi:hypothetical protein